MAIYKAPNSNLVIQMQRVLKRLGSHLRQRPRSTCALVFGTVALVVQHFIWVSSSRTNGLAPVLTMAVGLLHAVAGAITAPRLLDATRTRTPSQAGLLGAATSLVALLMFAPLYTVFMIARDLHPVGVLSYISLPFFVALFAFLADGWMLLVVSIGVGWGLYRVAAGQATHEAAQPRDRDQSGIGNKTE